MQACLPSNLKHIFSICGLLILQSIYSFRKQVRQLGKFFSFSFLWGFFQWFYTAGGDCGFSNFPTFGLKAYHNMYVYYITQPTFIFFFFQNDMHMLLATRTIFCTSYLQYMCNFVVIGIMQISVCKVYFLRDFLANYVIFDPFEFAGFTSTSQQHMLEQG